MDTRHRHLSNADSAAIKEAEDRARDMLRANDRQHREDMELLDQALTKATLFARCHSVAKSSREGTQ